MILQLLKIEWLKLKNYRTFWILTGLLLLCVIGVNSTVFNLYQRQMDSSNGKMVQALTGSIYQFPEIWHTVTLTSSFLQFIPSLLIIIVITNEFNFKTHRQNIIDGLSRIQFVISKLLLVVVVAVVCTLLVTVTTAVLGMIEGNSRFSFTNSYYIIYYFIQTLSYLTFALVLSLLLKRSGITIALFFIYIVIFENIVVAGINRAFTGNAAKGPGYFLFLEAPDKLIHFDTFKQFAGKDIFPADSSLLVACTIYLCLYLSIAYLKIKRADL